MNAIKLCVPFKEEELNKVNAGDLVELTGTIFCGRDKVHKLLSEKSFPELQKKMADGLIYHCGPILKKGVKWQMVSAGPTTSMRMEKFMPEIIKNYRIKGVMGKGGMGKNTLNALKENNAVYFLAIGGTAALLAGKILEVKNVFFIKEFSETEALWEITVKDFPAIASMAKGISLHEKILESSKEKLKEIK